MPHGNLNNELSMEEIPEELITELKKAFDPAFGHPVKVVFDLDSEITSTTRSFKTHTRVQDSKPIQGTVLDPTTFQPTVVNGYSTKTFVVRIDTTDTKLIVRRVLVIEIFLPV